MRISRHMRRTILALALFWSTVATAQPTAPDGTFRVFFDWAKPELTRDAQAILDEAVASFARMRPQQVLIHGHSDRSGADAANLRSSRRRAEAVRDYLATRGVPPAVMAVRAHGEAQPIIPTEDGVREAQNRRVEIIFEPGRAGQDGVSAQLLRADRSTAGTARLIDSPDGSSLIIDAERLPPGTHGLHLHAVGRCDPPDFSSAGPHWNPGNRQHGLQNPLGPHSGDLPDLIVDSTGRARVSLNAASGALDADGAALVIHADPDDDKTDPSGNSGARIACAAFKP